MSEASAILRSNLERERRIKELKESREAKSHGPEIAELSTKVRQEYRKLIVQHTSFLTQEKRDVDGLLWKNCFYKRIEEFRRSLKKHTPELKQLTPYTAAYDKHCLLLSKLSFSFKSFLSDSVKFYQDMMAELETRVKQHSTSDTTDNDKASAMLRCVYRCVLYLGDLERYKELYFGAEPKDFKQAEQYYVKANIYNPASGNAHNQLAMLATYNESEVVAVYRYCRSILVRQPFTGGFENLGTLFTKNNKAFASLKDTRALFDPNTDVKAGRTADHTSGVKLKSLIIKFIKLHGMLFDWTVQMHKASEASMSIAESAVSGLYSSDLEKIPLNAEKFLNLLHPVLDEFELQLIGSSPLSSTLLLRLLCICYFSIHHAVAKGHNMLLNSFSSKSNKFVADSDKDYLDKRIDDGGSRTSMESMALIMLFGLISKVATRITLAMTSAEKGCKPAMNRLIPALSVFCDWATAHSNYLLNPPSPPSSSLSAGDKSQSAFYATTDLLQKESRMLAAMVASLSPLVSILEKDMTRNRRMNHPDTDDNSDDDDGDDNDCDRGKVKVHFLKEHIELRGFLPLATRYEERFVKFNPVVNAIAFMGEEVARYHRENNITSFVNTLLLPATATSVESPSSKSRDRDRDGEKVERGGRSLRDRERGRERESSGNDRARDRDRDRGRQRKDRDRGAKLPSSTSGANLPGSAARGRTTNWENHDGNASSTQQQNTSRVGAETENEYPTLPPYMSQDQDADRTSSAKADKSSYLEKLQGSDAAPAIEAWGEAGTGTETETETEESPQRPTRSRGPPAMAPAVALSLEAVLSGRETGDRSLALNHSLDNTIAGGAFDYSVEDGADLLDTLTRAMDADNDYDDFGETVVYQPVFSRGSNNIDDLDLSGAGSSTSSAGPTALPSSQGVDATADIVSSMRGVNEISALNMSGKYDDSFNALIQASRTTSLPNATSHNDIISSISGGSPIAATSIFNNNLPPSLTQHLAGSGGSTIQQPNQQSNISSHFVTTTPSLGVEASISATTGDAGSSPGTGPKFSDMFGQESFNDYWQTVEMGLSFPNITSLSLGGEAAPTPYTHSTAHPASSTFAHAPTTLSTSSPSFASTSSPQMSPTRPTTINPTTGNPLFVSPLPPGLQQNGPTTAFLPPTLPPGLISQNTTPTNTAFSSQHNSSNQLNDYQSTDGFNALDYLSNQQGLKKERSAMPDFGGLFSDST